PDRLPRREGVFLAFHETRYCPWLFTAPLARSCPQVNGELVFRSAGGAGRSVDNHPLGRPHARSDDEPAITAQIICIPGAPEERFVKFGRRGSGGTGWHARDLEGDGRHGFALVMIL